MPTPSSTRTPKRLSPRLTIRRLGLVSRDYRFPENNGYSDFSLVFPAILRRFDALACDAVLFSLYTLVQRRSFQVTQVLNDLELQSLRSIFVEEFQDKFCTDLRQRVRTPIRFGVHYRLARSWRQHEVQQAFGTVPNTPGFLRQVIRPYLKEVREQRRIGNALLVVCGESNIVKYSPASKRVTDPFGFLTILPADVNLILNPVHDRMTRFEMKRKRCFLSQQGRWVVSVWNKGKADRRGRVRDGRRPPWTVYHDGVEVQPLKLDASVIESRSSIEMALLVLS